MTELNLSPSQILPIRDEIAIVTGGASGIGAATVRLLAAHGAHPWFCDINTMAGETIAASVPNSHFIFADVTDWQSLLGFFTDVFNCTGRIDLVFANAGYISPSATSLFTDLYTPTGYLAEPDLSTLDVTLKGSIYTAKLALSFFRRNPRSPTPPRYSPTTTPFQHPISQTTSADIPSPNQQIYNITPPKYPSPPPNPPSNALIFTASASSYASRPNLPLYSSSKHGVLGLMRSLRSFTLPSNSGNSNVPFHTAAVAPGATLTNMVTSTTASRLEAAGVQVQQAEYIALALVIQASNPQTNGQCWALQGNRCTEVEEPLQRLKPQWYGEWHAEQAERVTNVVIQK